MADYPYGIGGFTGRIGALGPMQIVGAPPGFPMQLPGGFRPPQGLPYNAGVPYGMPHPGALAGPIPGMHVQQSPQSDAYALILAIPSTGVLAAGASATVAVVPQRPMRIERFVTAQDTSGVFTVGNILAGVDSQFIGAGAAVDASLFRAGAFGVALRGSTVYPGITISIVITNISVAAATAQGWMFVGTAIA